MLRLKFRLFLTTAATVVLIFSCSKDENSSIPPEIEENNVARAAAKKLYEDYYEASKTSASDEEWNGNSNNCQAGNIPQGIMDKIFQRVHYYRLAVGLNNTITENPEQSAKAQQAALMMKSNGTLDHFPPASWSCYTADGSEAAGKSNLAMWKNAEAIDLYISEPGESNGPVGHRRWMLYPRLNSIGVGNTDSSNVVWVVGNTAAAPSDTPEFIAWPPADYVPDSLVFPRWSFSIPGADFSQSTVSMVDEFGTNIALSLEELSNVYGDPTIVWVPSGINTNVTEDTAYRVRLSNVEVDGEMETYEYAVILFDPGN